MTRQMITTLVLPVCCALALGACGGDDEPSVDTGSAPPAAQAQTQSEGGEKCEDVMVTGHEAVDVKATGVGCAVAEKVAGAAEGRGRAAYKAEAFACEPSEAGGGDTNYSCSMGPAKITFRYGTG